MTIRSRIASASMSSLCAAFALCLAGLAGASADEAKLAPQTKLKVTVVQWMPTKGQYEAWSALGGDFVVSSAGTVTLPVLGTMAVGDLNADQLSAEIAKQLQAKIGLVDKPAATVEIVEFPPFYVVGDVFKPGDYKFREGLSVLQAVAMSGGVLRLASERFAGDATVVGDLRKIAGEEIVNRVKMARLQAETNGATDIAFPSDLTALPDAAGAIAQERVIFAARAKSIERQSKSYEELRDLLNAEINVLQQKITDADNGLKSMEDQLTRVKELVEKGIAVTSRQSDLERAVASYRAERLDQVTAVMRARQAIAEATRNLEGLQDQQQTQIATELQQTQAQLNELRIRRETQQRLLMAALDGQSPNAAEPEKPTVYRIVRQTLDGPQEIDATETTLLEPSDVIKVRRPGSAQSPQAPGQGPAAAASASGSSAQASQ
jgi:protein involved in polysaccharide export with SLBB domain